MAKLDITDRLRPQDGRAKIHVDGRKYDLRISTVPTRQSEKAVIRVLDTQGSGTLDETGIVRVGTFVSAGDILVGKVVPKSKSEDSR